MRLGLLLVPLAVALALRLAFGRWAAALAGLAFGASVAGIALPPSAPRPAPGLVGVGLAVVLLGLLLGLRRTLPPSEEEDAPSASRSSWLPGAIGLMLAVFGALLAGDAAGGASWSHRLTACFLGSGETDGLWWPAPALLFALAGALTPAVPAAAVASLGLALLVRETLPGTGWLEPLLAFAIALLAAAGFEHADRRARWMALGLGLATLAGVVLSGPRTRPVPVDASDELVTLLQPVTATAELVGWIHPAVAFDELRLSVDHGDRQERFSIGSREELVANATVLRRELGTGDPPPPEEVLLFRARPEPVFSGALAERPVTLEVLAAGEVVGRRCVGSLDPLAVPRRWFAGLSALSFLGLLSARTRGLTLLALFAQVALGALLSLG